MGRMAHEASAIDPATGYWYLTEDQGNANTLYRFLPNNIQGGLNSLHAGGRLQGLKVRNVQNADLRDPMLCQEYAVEWVDVPAPDMDGATLGVVSLGTRLQRWTAPEFVVDSDRPVPVGIDGEALVMDPPLVFRSRPRALRVRIAQAHPGASPSSDAPVSAWAAQSIDPGQFNRRFIS